MLPGGAGEDVEPRASLPLSGSLRFRRDYANAGVLVVWEEKEPCHLPSQESAEHPLRRRADCLPIALQLDRGLPEGKARHQDIID